MIAHKDIVEIGDSICRLKEFDPQKKRLKFMPSFFYFRTRKPDGELDELKHSRKPG